ncbi:MAG: hypothetical protein QE494_17660 [Ramlibacter sp.]|nr:hypothetical protein [Ramlibacter sp.]
MPRPAASGPPQGAVQPARDWRSRHPVLAVSLSSAVRDALGQGTGRVIGAVVLAGIQSSLHHPDPALQASRESLLAFAGGGAAMLASGVAGAYTGNMLSLAVHRRDAAAERRSPLWVAGLVPPLLLASGMVVDAHLGGRAGLALGTGQALARVVQYLGRDTAGQAYTAAMQYRRNGLAPGFRLRVLQQDGRPLADADPAGFNRFTVGRLKIASLIYALLCVGCFTMGLWMQEHRFKPGEEDHSFEGFLRGSFGMVLATVVLEALDGINGVVCHQIQAWRQGLKVELNEEETQVENLPQFVMTHALARTATNSLHDLAGALERGMGAEREFSPVWFALRVVPRTVAQVLTEPRGFLANTSIEVRQAQTAAALARHDAQAQNRPALRPAAAAAAASAAPPPQAHHAPRMAVMAVMTPRRQAWGSSPGEAAPGVDTPPPALWRLQPLSVTDDPTPRSSTGTPGSQAMGLPEWRPPSALEIHRPHSRSSRPGTPGTPNVERKYQ